MQSSSPVAQPTILSGVKPSGQPTLGNYLGAFRPFSKFLAQKSHRVFMMIADHHVINTHPAPQDLYEQTLNIAAWYMASGLNPADCTLFVQSHVPEHTELAWILNSFVTIGELSRMTQFKEKGRADGHKTNAGLQQYPVLMAADILLYQATDVPVGDDQIQHVELCRDIATRFNNHYETKVLTVPKAVKPVTAERVRDLQNPLKKMSKSEGGSGCIVLEDNVDGAVKKITRAVTDSLNHIAYNPTEQPGVANLLEILAACRGTTPQAQAQGLAGQGYGTLKTITAEAVAELLTPLQAEYHRLLADKAELQRILATGAAHAEAVAATTLAKVKATVGYLPKFA